VVSRQFYCTISSEGLFIFYEAKTPYLCGFRRFANAYFKVKIGGGQMLICIGGGGCYQEEGKEL